MKSESKQDKELSDVKVFISSYDRIHHYKELVDKVTLDSKAYITDHYHTKLINKK